jgi:hypothetical protein
MTREDYVEKLGRTIDVIGEMAKDIHRLREALVDIEELVDGYVDITSNGGPNLAMQILTVVHIALGKER